MQDNKKLIFMILVLVLLVGISGVVILTRKDSVAEVILTDSTVEEMAVIEVHTEVPVVKDTSGQGEATQVAEVETTNPPVAKTSLESTDPSTVNLASGSIQLVELFAFW